MNDSLQQILVILGTIVVVAALLGIVGLLLLHRSLRRLRIPPGADLATTLRVVPLTLVVVLDLLDLGLDVFATPIVWLVLSRYRLHALRNVAAIEALIPFTQVVPTLTVAWFAVRVLGLGRDLTDQSIIDAEEREQGYYVPRTGRR